MTTLKASLAASAIGTGAWLLGLTGKIWPAHPQWALFFLTIAAAVLLRYAWEARHPSEKSCHRSR